MTTAKPIPAVSSPTGHNGASARANALVELHARMINKKGA